MINKEQVKDNFSRAATTYDRYAGHQYQVGTILLDWLPAGFVPDAGCDIGCGTGRLTRELALRFPKGNWLAVDIAPNMIEYAREKNVLANIRYLAADAEGYGLPAGAYQVLFSNFALQWFTDVKRFFSKVMSSLSPGGYFLFSLSLASTYRELKDIFLTAKKEWPALPGHGYEACRQLLTTCGFSVTRSMEREDCLAYDSLLGLLEVISNTGSRAAVSFKERAPLTRGEIGGMEREYFKRYSNGSNLQATFHWGAFLCRRD